MSAQEAAISSSSGCEDGSAESFTTWIPLESDPDIMTEYLRMLTLTEHYLIDVPIIDGAEEMGIFAGHNVKAFIFLYEINARTESEVAQSTESPDAPADLYHMKQLIRNACGSVALFHAYINSVDPQKFEPSSIMHKFYAKTVGLDWIKRGELFSGSEEISSIHYESACQGQTGVPTGQDLNNINYHFVAIINKNGAVYKMDGRCNKPVKMGDCPEGGFIAAGLNAIKTMIARDPDNYNFSILAFCGN